jgi:hypothetical protein
MSVFPACHTLFKHPRLSQLDYRRPEGNACLTCHSSQELWRFTHPSAIPSQRGPWRDYYDRVWWHERRWSVGADADSTASSEDR